MVIPGGWNHRLTLAYLGSGFAGWQRQSNALSVQEVVETALERVVGERARVCGASRTDAGVHAAGQEAHVVLARPWPRSALIEGLNRHLPSDVRVLRATMAAPDFNARSWAVAKEYRYRMSRRRVLSPFEAATTVRVPDLDWGSVRAAVALLPGRHDWSAFARTGGSHTQSFRRVFHASVDENGGAELELRIVGDGFLRGMVRALVGSLLWVGTGKLTLERFVELLGGGARPDAGPSAPAGGLVLTRVFYPDENASWPG